ncbi:MAG: glycosyltransferase, partial [Paludibacteraceae bacterium]
MKATLIVSIYRNVVALEAILHSLHQQTEQDFELILSEDGDDAVMCRFIDNYHFPWQTQHLTQTDEGWRKNRALNRAIVAAHCDWLIFIDGDCVLHPRFVEMHIKHK